MANVKSDSEKLLSDRRVVEEIQRHLWIESEKAGCDIGFEQAKVDWLQNFSKAWMEYHMPDSLLNSRRKSSPKAQTKKSAQKRTAPKRRRAKSYLK